MDKYTKLSQAILFCADEDKYTKIKNVVAGDESCIKLASPFGFNMAFETVYAHNPYYAALILKDLISAGIDLEKEDLRGARLVHHICYYRDVALLKLIADRVDLNVKTFEGNTPLDICYNKIKKDDDCIQIVQILVERGADTDSFTARLNTLTATPLVINCRNYMGSYEEHRIFDVIEAHHTSVVQKI